MGYVFISLTIFLTVYGQLIIKQQINLVPNVPSGMDLIPFLLRFMFRPWVITGLASAVLASLAWMAALTRFELSYAYPFMSLNFLVVVALSIFFFNESINFYKLVGLLFICAGVLIVSKGS